MTIGVNVNCGLYMRIYAGCCYVRVWLHGCFMSLHVCFWGGGTHDSDRTKKPELREKYAVG